MGKKATSALHLDSLRAKQQLRPCLSSTSRVFSKTFYFYYLFFFKLCPLFSTPHTHLRAVASRSRGRERPGGGAASHRAGDPREEPGSAAAALHAPAVQLQHLEQRRLPATHWSVPGCLFLEEE